MAGATGLEPAASAVTGRRRWDSSSIFSKNDSTPSGSKSCLKNRDSTLELKRKTALSSVLFAAFLTVALDALLSGCTPFSLDRPELLADANGNAVVRAR